MFKMFRSGMCVYVCVCVCLSLCVCVLGGLNRLCVRARVRIAFVACAFVVVRTLFPFLQQLSDARTLCQVHPLCATCTRDARHLCLGPGAAALMCAASSRQAH